MKRIESRIPGNFFIKSLPDGVVIRPGMTCTMGPYYDGDVFTRIDLAGVENPPYQFIDVMFKDGEPVIGTHGVSDETAAAVWAALKAHQSR